MKTILRLVVMFFVSLVAFALGAASAVFVTHNLDNAKYAAIQQRERATENIAALQRQQTEIANARIAKLAAQQSACVAAANSLDGWTLIAEPNESAGAQQLGAFAGALLGRNFSALASMLSGTSSNGGFQGKFLVRGKFTPYAATAQPQSAEFFTYDSARGQWSGPFAVAPAPPGRNSAQNASSGTGGQ